MDNRVLILRSGAFVNGGEIPIKYTCVGKNISPPLTWQGVPAGTKSLVLIIHDPDAPDPDKPMMDWVHWVVYNIPLHAQGLPEGANVHNLPPGAEQGVNDWNNAGYGGPCPPIGRHRYFHKLYALDCYLPGLKAPTRTTVESAMQGHVVESTELMGTFAQ